jgi:hypothetical protein
MKVVADRFGSAAMMNMVNDAGTTDRRNPESSGGVVTNSVS